MPTLDISETNLANFGTELETNIKAAAAENEAQWDGVENSSGLRIWRIEKFQVVPWPEAEYGKFYTGDSYIVLNAVEVEDQKIFDVHFWLGVNTTTDEAGTAAYKTVELDDKLGGKATQHREIQAHESPRFIGYFDGKIRLLSGGVESGFNHVTEEEYVPKFFQVARRKGSIIAQEVSKGEPLNNGDVYIVDTGKVIYQWHGSGCNAFEKNAARELSSKIADENGGDVTVIDQGDEPEEFWAALGGQQDVNEDEGSRALFESAGEKKLFKLSESDDGVEFEEVGSGELSKDALATDDVFLVDNEDECFVWIGTESSAKERACGLHYAQQYLQKQGRSLTTSIVALKEGVPNADFDACFA